MWRATETYDERFHIAYGKRILQIKSDKNGNEGIMPFSCINILPQKIGELLNNVFESNKVTHFFYSLNSKRLITILFSLLLAIYVFRWSNELYGVTAGIFSLILYIFEPNMIAHSGLVTLDLFSACMTTLSTYYFWRFVKIQTPQNAAVSAALLGVSQLTKFTCAFLYPIYAFIILIKCSKDLFNLIKIRNYKGLLNHLNSFLKYSLFFVLVGLIIINIGFLFNRTFTPFGEYKFQSSSFKTIQSQFSFLKHIPVPIPYPYLDSLDLHKFHEETGGHQHGLEYLFGRLHDKGGFKGYYFYAFLYKVPIAIQFFILWSIINYILKYKTFMLFDNEIFIFCPIIFYTLYLNFILSMDIGIRNSILVFPFLIVFCGSFFKNWTFFNLRLKTVIITLIAYLIISVLSYYPHYLSYFNELVWDRKMAYKILADSNLDWGQSGWYLDKYIKEHPGIKYSPEFPVAGRVVVGVNGLVGLNNPEEFKWLRDNFKPIDHIAYSYLIYDISLEDLERIKNSQ